MRTVPKAGWWPRAGAMLIDALILTAVALVVGIVAAASGASTDTATIAIYVAIFLATVIYSPLMMARPGAVNGQTVGKQALGIRVVHAEGGEMTVSRGLLRDGVGKALLGIIPFYSIVDVLVPLFDQQNQALHDKVGSTFVVLADAEQAIATDRDLTPAEAPHAAWSAPSQPVPPAGSAVPSPFAPPPPPPPPDTAPLPPLPPPPPEPTEPPDLGGFAPPVAPAPAPARDEDEDARPRGPFGPSYD
jgi:uncharacterized RDD family membrane protein YckC